MGTIAHASRPASSSYFDAVDATHPQALDDALRLRQRGRARIDHACEMRELFDSYCNLAGPFADAEDASHRGAAYLIYCDAFRRLQERCRADAAAR
jgi:hypothetical protein